MFCSTLSICSTCSAFYQHVNNHKSSKYCLKKSSKMEQKLFKQKFRAFMTVYMLIKGRASTTSAVSKHTSSFPWYGREPLPPAILNPSSPLSFKRVVSTVYKEQTTPKNPSIYIVHKINNSSNARRVHTVFS